MKIKTTEQEGVQIISLHGDLTGGPEADTLHQTLAEFLKDDKHDFIIDLTHVGFMNSTGIGIVIRCFTTTVRAGGKLKGVAPETNRAFTILNIVQLNKIMDIYETIEDALAAFGKERDQDAGTA